MYIGDIEADGLLPELTKLHCYVVKDYLVDKWYIACEKSELDNSYVEELEGKYSITWIPPSSISSNLQSLGGLVIHNLWGYDLEALKKLGYISSYDYNEVDGKRIDFWDSLSMSRCLNPDRRLPRGCPTTIFNPVTKKNDKVGAHGLLAWGYRSTNKKPVIHDWRNQPLGTYLNRCIEDVLINENTYTMLLKEASSVAKGGSWDIALKINNKSDFLMCKQERDGIKLDIEKTERLMNNIDGMMEEIANDVNPQLPERPMPKSMLPIYPAKPFTTSGDISSHGWKWLEKLGYEVNEEALDKVKIPTRPFKADGSISASGKAFCEKMGWSEESFKEDLSEFKKEQDKVVPLEESVLEEALKDLHDKRMPKTTIPMVISNQDDIKKYLFSDEGWVPTIWRTKDITRDQNKRELSEQEQKEKLEKYIEDTLTSPYRNLIYDEMEVNFERVSRKLLAEKLSRQARFLVTTPKLKDERGELCPNLERLKGEMAKQIVKWLSLRNRRSVIKTKDETKNTGWLNNERLKVDGRIGQGFSGVTNTNRYKHSVIVNLPKAAPDVLLGKEMRGLFIAEKGNCILGYDGSNLEQFVAASYAYTYDNGAFAEQLAGDAHLTNSKAYSIAAGREVSRNEGKGISYSILYGGQAKKVGKMMGLPPKKAQQVINAFWDTNYGLKALKEKLEAYWESTGKRYIRGIDGRKIYTRSKHSLVNALFQSCGSILMFLSGCLMYDMLKEEGLLEESIRLIFTHDEYQYEIPKKSLGFKKFESKEEAKEWGGDGRLWSNVKEVDGTYYRFYSRVGELGNLSLERAGKYLKMNMPFSAAYDVGNNLAETH